MDLLGIAWENILIGIAAALVVGGFIQIKDYIYNKYLEYKFPIAGKYITTFEDEIDEELTLTTAPATLEQEGRSISGRTILPDDNRVWVLEGEISGSGYMNGVYYALDPHDRGIGNFFLYINYDRHMEGLWSGYDEVNKKITSGRYTFTPIFDSYTIQLLTAEQIPAVIDIVDNRLGRDYISAKILDNSLDDQSPYFTHVAVTNEGFSKESSIADRLADRFLDQHGPKIDEGMLPTETRTAEVIGVCLGAVFDTEQLDAYLNIDRSDLPVGLQHADRIGVVRTVAVGKGFEKQGVGTDLVENCIQNCLDKNAEVLCAVGWEQDGQVNIKGMMDHFKFDEAGEFEEYWHEESQKNGYYCDSCGEPPCTCSAMLFVRYG